jgi:hypothetical protein
LPTAGELPDGIRIDGSRSDPTPSAIPGTRRYGPSFPCGDPLTHALQKTVSAAVDPTGLGWQGSEFLYLYRPGQACQIMADIAQTAGRCSAKPISSGSGGSAVPFGNLCPSWREWADEALEINVHSPVPHDPASMSGLFTASNWIVIRSGNVLPLSDEMGNISTLDKYLTAATSVAWRV